MPTKPNVMQVSGPFQLNRYGAPVCAGHTEDPTTGVQQVMMIDDETGADTDVVICTTAPADVNVARWVLEQGINTHDAAATEGRSPFLWVRLQNGDLLLAVYPQAEVYEATETDPNRP